MSINCKSCRSEKIVKNGFSHREQRYRCQECKYNFIEGDKRVRYSALDRLKVIKLYLENCGIRTIVGIMTIERAEEVSNPLIIKWIRNFSKILRNKLNETKIPESARDVQILELDEMFSYCQKKLTKSTYGLLLIDNEIRLLTLK